MIISAKEMADKSDDEQLKQDIFAIGVKELELWKIAVKSDKKLFDSLFQLIFSNEKRLAWRSCWIIDTASEDFPEILVDKLPEIITGLIATNDGSLKRHFTRILCRYTIPEDFLGVTVNRCFELLGPSEAAAVRVNSMQLLFNISQDLPDLQGELISVIENLVEEGGSAGFMNRAAKLIRKLHS